MSNHSDRAAGFVAANRFGLGARPGEIDDISEDPRGWLKAQLKSPVPEQFYNNIPSTHAMFDLEETWRLELLELAQNTDPQTERQAQLEQGQNRIQIEREHLALRLRLAIETTNPFMERLVRFWSNHFTIAVSAVNGIKGVLRTIAVPYENEAIRHNLSADFETLLVAVEQHPAMLIYLDNERSIGPNSVAGKRRDIGLNENLAREILELHTLAVNGGYTQADIGGLAKMITGWTVMRQPGRSGAEDTRQTGSFQFYNERHEPGVHVLLGKSYDGNDQMQGENALKDLARHPSTAKHIAGKLVTHFVADTPPPTAVAKIEQVFIKSGGDLPAIHEALIDLEEVWQQKNKKLKNPEEFLVSTVRALGVDSFNQGFPGRFNALSQILSIFNHLPFTANSPAGWPDSADHWGSPDALLKRIELADRVANQSPATLDPMKLYTQIMPESDQLKQAIGRAESQSQGLALLLASPDFQWR